MKEWILWALPRGEDRPWMEELLLTHATRSQIEKVKKLAAKDGWHHFRVDVIDLTKPPDFESAIRKR